MKKPKFLQQDYHKKPGLKKKWKRPKGLHSKMRLKKRGYRRGVSKGYKAAKKERGLYKGLKVIKIGSPKDLKIIEKEKTGIVISKNIGLKKRLEIVKGIEKEGLKVINLDIKKFLKEAEELLEKKKEERGEKAKEKVKKKGEGERTAKKKVEEKTLEKKVEKSEEEIKKEKKKEKDKILTKKEN